MTLALWTEYESTALMQSVIQTTTPLVDAGSLWMRRNGAGGSNRSIARVPGPTLDRAYTVGRIRHLFRVTQCSGSSTSWMGFGCMMSQEDLTGGAGSAYGLCLITATATGTLGSMSLVKFTAGYTQAVTAGGTTVIATETFSPQVTINTTVAVEMRWRLDVPQFGGVNFQIYRGSLADFSDLALKIDTTHVSSPLTTSVNEWVGMYAHSSGDFECYIDQTRHTRRA